MKKLFIYISIVLHIVVIIISLFKFSDIFDRKIKDNGYSVFDFVAIGDKSSAPVLSKDNGKASKTKSYADNKEDEINKHNNNSKQKQENENNNKNKKQIDEKDKTEDNNKQEEIKKDNKIEDKSKQEKEKQNNKDSKSKDNISKQEKENSHNKNADTKNNGNISKNEKKLNNKAKEDNKNSVSKQENKKNNINQMEKNKNKDKKQENKSSKKTQKDNKNKTNNNKYSNKNSNQNKVSNTKQSNKNNSKALVNLKRNKKSSSNYSDKNSKKSFNSFLDNVLADGDNENTGANAESLGDTLTATQIDNVRNTIRKCWHFPAGLKNAETLVVEVKMELDRNGYVKKAEVVDKNRMRRDSAFKIAAENAQRAVLDPACNPLPLPKEKYNEWKDLELSFNPKDML